MTPYFADESVTLLLGDALEVLREMPDASVDCCVTSPPYYGLRDYGVDGQYGLEVSPAEYVERMREVFAEVRRVLVPDGTTWLNIGDSYYSGKGNPGPGGADAKQPARRGWVRPLDQCGVGWAKPKNLLGIPWRVAFALQDDGWTLRNAIVWHKPNAMPESVADRMSCDYEHVFLFARSPRYWFDLDANGTNYPAGVRPQTGRHRTGNRRKYVGGGDLVGRNPGSVWDIATQPFAGAHFAVMPLALADRLVRTGCKPGGVVLDPFSGVGTTGLAATRAGRRYIGIDLSAETLDLSLRTRLAQSALTDGAA